MLYCQWCVYLLLAVSSSFASPSFSAKSHHTKQISYQTIYVDPLGKGNFTTIQAAVDSIPSNNKAWTCIQIKQGVYKEQVTIPYDKPFIYLKGESKRKTFVVWDGHDSIAAGATFTSLADNIIAKSITFVNSYNSPPKSNKNPMKPAVAASIQGDKSVFYRCQFFGVQDTLWDCQGRHYFKHCTIQGAVDFIFGSGQSLYEKCTISVVAGVLKNGAAGFITAQGRSKPQETNGFVFKECDIVGNGKTYLGRPWRSYARVIFYNTSMSDIVVPQGWDSWYSTRHKDKLTFAEHNCHGLGSNTSRRVKWAKKLSKKNLRQFTRISYIDNEGWLSKLAISITGP